MINQVRQAVLIPSLALCQAGYMQQPVISDVQTTPCQFAHACAVSCKTRKHIYTSHKKVFSMTTSTCRDGTLKNQPNKIGTTPQYFYTIPTSCANLPTMHCVCYLCAQKGCLGHGSLWNEQYWVCSACCCVWRVGCVVGGCNFVAIECGRHG